jgi:hypothetical protein
MNWGLPPIKVMVAGALAAAQRHASQPKDKKNRGQNPEEMHGEPETSKEYD